MTTEELHDRYIQEIEKRGDPDKYIDGIEERELMQIAIQHGFPPDRARAFVVGVCQEKGYVIEASIVQLIREKLKQHSKPDGTIDRVGFNTIVESILSELAQTTRTRHEILQLVVNTMDDLGYRHSKKWWHPNWYLQLKKQIGLN